jgi:hypothetical protein
MFEFGDVKNKCFIYNITDLNHLFFDSAKIIKAFSSTRRAREAKRDKDTKLTENKHSQAKTNKQGS